MAIIIINSEEGPGPAMSHGPVSDDVRGTSHSSAYSSVHGGTPDPGTDIPESLREIVDNHMSGGGHSVNYYFGRDNRVKGGYCTKCDVEWLPDYDGNVVDYKPPTIKRFWCLTIADMGIQVDEENMEDTLEKGDHVAWQKKCGGYWHHAIVENVDRSAKTLSVIEWKRKQHTSFEINLRSVEGQFDRTCGQMYRVEYPSSVLQYNRPDIVMMRAQSRVCDTGYNLFYDNCEHFARYCKTGKPQSNQILRVLAALGKLGCKILLTLVRIFVTIAFAQTTRLLKSQTFYFGSVILFLFVFELIYAIVALVIIWREKPDYKDERPCRPRGCAAIKLVTESFIIFVFASLFTLIPLAFRGINDVALISLETVLGLIGGIIGLFIGQVVIAVCSGRCCCKNVLTSTGRINTISQTIEM